MSTFGLFLVAVGVMIIATRGPLVVAPHATRSLYMRILDNDARMRGWSLIAAILGVVAVFASQTATGVAADIAFWLGLFIVVMALGAVLVFPTQLRALAEKIWSGFTGPVLRILGVISVAFGAFLVFYGMQI